MRVSKLVLLYSLCALMISGCSKDSSIKEHADALDSVVQSTSHASMESHSHTKETTLLSAYQKPGVALEFVSQYDGSTRVGETEVFSLEFSEPYETGVMSIRIEPQGGLQLTSPQEAFFSLQDERLHTVEVELSSELEGRHDLYIYARINHPDLSPNDQTKAFALAINVGDLAQLTDQKTPDVSGSGTNSVILLPAEETIIQEP